MLALTCQLGRIPGLRRDPLLPIIAADLEGNTRHDPAPNRAGTGSECRFTASDGLELAGTYFQARTTRRLGVVVFCHEFLGDRWNASADCDGFKRSFDIFSFDFRNHGESEVEPGLRRLQWVSDRELTDLRAALDYLRTRPDRDPAGVGLFGVSRGGGTALCLAAKDPSVWAVATNGGVPNPWDDGRLYPAMG